MAEPFKKQLVRFYAPDGRRCEKNAPGAIKEVVESRKYYGFVGQPNGKRKQIPLCPDLASSKKLLNKLLTDTTMRQHGMADPYESHRKRPLAKHLADFQTALSAKGNSPAYIALVLGRLQAVADACAWQMLSDLSASQADEWLAGQRTAAQSIPLLPTDRDIFTPRETAKLLDVSLTAIRSSIKKYCLGTIGQGRGRRYPRATVQAMLDRQGQGTGAQTRNHYRTHLRSFGNWLVRARRLGESPFRHMESENMTVDRRHDRRELLAAEIQRLLDSARNSPRSFRGLSGADRFHLYAMACGTGFRASALANLMPENFNLDDGMPTVTLPARHAKNRKTKVQPLPPDVADLLRDYLAEKPAGRPIWGGTWARDHRGAEMLRGDLDAAGIPYIVEGPDGPLHADFHSLRHSYLTLGGRAGIDLRTLQELAGHSTPALTARYSHRRLHDLVGAIEKFPTFLPTDAANAKIEQSPMTKTAG
jgi:integrase